MNTFEAICSRKSIRNYTGEPPAQEELDKILAAAYAAPIAVGKYETVALSVVTNAEMLEAINESGRKLFGDDSLTPLYGAPMLVIVSSLFDPNGAVNVPYSNAAIVVENMALAAVDLGLGTCHIWGAIAGMNQNPELLKKLDLPEGFVPCCALTLGKTAEKYGKRKIPDERIKTRYIR